MSKQRFKKAEFAAWVGIVGNLILAALKAVVGYISGTEDRLQTLPIPLPMLPALLLC